MTVSVSTGEHSAAENPTRSMTPRFFIRHQQGERNSTRFSSAQVQSKEGNLPVCTTDGILLTVMPLKNASIEIVRILSKSS